MQRAHYSFAQFSMRPGKDASIWCLSCSDRISCVYVIFVADNVARGGNQNFMRLLNGNGIAVTKYKQSANRALKRETISH